MAANRDVSANAFAVVEQIARSLGMQEGELASGVVHTPSPQTDGLTWDEFCDMVDRLVERAGAPTALKELGACAFEVPINGPLIRVLRSVAGCQGLFWANFRWGGPSLFPLVSTSFVVRRDGTFLGTISLPPTVRDCAGFFYICAGFFQALPRVLGLQDAHVAVTVGKRVATYSINPPRPPSIFARIRWAFGALGATQELVDRLAEQNAALAQANRDADQARRVAIEARQRLEESLADVQAAMAARGQFVNMVSHELRTPLGGILGMAELLSMTPLLPDQRRHLDVITRSGEALLRLINDLLDLSKLDSGRLSLELTKVNLREVVDAVVAAASQKANAKSLDLVADVAPDVPAQITSDPLRLRQVLSNLVDNAIKFTHRGHVAVRLTFDADNQRIRCIVEDTGIGIAPMHAARIFEPFMQADNSTTRRYGGTGLGLSISRSLAAHLGGALEFASDEGRGSRFWIDVPAVDAVPLRPPVSRGTAYLMAGEPIRTALEHALLGLGWEISAEKPDVTLVDIDKFSLPTEATRVIRMSRSGHPGSLRLPATLHELTEAVAVVSGPRLKVAAIGRDLVVSAILARCVVVLGHRAPTADETPDLVLVDEEGAAEAASRWPGVRVVEVGAPVDLAHVRDALGPVAMA